MKRLTAIFVAMVLLMPLAACSRQQQAKSTSDHSLARRRLDQAIAEVRKGQVSKAKQLLDQSIAADPNYADAHNNMGNVLMTTGNYKDASVAYSKAISIGDKRVPYLANRGYAYFLLGSMREALKDFNRVIELDPNNYQSLSFRGQVRMQLADFEGAVTDLDRVMTLRPDNGGVYASRGVALASLGRYRAAEDDFLKAEAIFRKAGDSANLNKLFKAKTAFKGLENN